MLTLAFGLICAAIVAGAVLAVGYLRAAAAPPAVAIAHGALGAAGLAALLLALRRGLPETAFGTEGFGAGAAALLAPALALGLVLGHAGLRRRRPAATLVVSHATLAITGFVLLLAIIALR
jgi:hypothetical protein